MIEAEGLSKSFGNVTAVYGLDFRIDEGEIFGLLGPNGAGKTTTMRMLACLLHPSGGTARIDGVPVGASDGTIGIRKNLGFLPESPGLYDNLSIYRNLEFYAQLYDVPDDKVEGRIRELLGMLGLWDRCEDNVGSLSKGMKQKVAIVRALVHDPKYLFLDEPTASLDPEASKIVRDFIARLKGEGRTILINTHNLAEAERLCDRVAILKTRILAVDSPRSMERRYFERRVEVRARGLDPGIVDGLRRFGFVRSVEAEGEALRLVVDNPEENNPVIVDYLVRAGAKLQFVSEVKHTLEDVYLKLMRG